MNNAPSQGPDPAEIRSRLIHWYDAHCRDLPWRRTRDPYAVLVSEIMLQQTRVDTALPYYLRFLQRFPSACHLAAAPEEEVLKLWQGLGYYRRARQLHRAARVLVERYGGRVPPDFEAIRSLPGVGDYTAGAVCSIAFDLPVPAVDGNAQRVLARLFGVDEPADRAAGRRRLDELARRLVEGPRPGALNQAVMELGSTVCTPRKPRCDRCPLAGLCVAGRSGQPEAWPVRQRAVRWAEEDVVVVGCVRGDQVAVIRRPEGGLLGGLWALPYALRQEGETWLQARDRLGAALAAELGEPLRWYPDTLQGRWDFSHRRWHWRLYLASSGGGPAPDRAAGAGAAAPPHGAALPGHAGQVAETPGAWASGPVRWVDLGHLDSLPMASLDRRLLEQAVQVLAMLPQGQVPGLQGQVTGLQEQAPGQRSRPEPLPGRGRTGPGGAGEAAGAAGQE
ncbi:A/G-specific adenine glycosylase [Thermaerobacter sp. PB12/4term]|nr:A/G-specific adenine glycosylase [Thermaerobacter sp. PB12/4term]